MRISAPRHEDTLLAGGCTLGVIFTSTREVMFSSALVNQLVCLFVSRIMQKLLDRFSQISTERRQMGTEETVRFWW